MVGHTLSAFTSELNALTGDVLRMGGLAEAMITDMATAFAHGDAELASKVIETDEEVDALESRIEREIMRLLALRQPVSQDLRTIVSALKVSNDLERIGDLAKNVCKRLIAMGDEHGQTGQKSVERMSKAVRLQLKTVLDAYSNDNAQGAIDVWLHDEEIDEHYNSMFREVLTYMMEDPRKISLGAHLLFIAKNLERIGDHCTNIAEVVHFCVTGDDLPLTRPQVSEIGQITES
ncbi:MAG: phosphate transport system regulatory protein PhoU [Ponticaulis sp.]|nr:phosphate transport system regulatory protein PhoU [Ponticaulis sp.]